jgi:thiol:disulfide interchange protein
MSDYGFKALIGALVLLGGIAFYRFEHPRTAFVPDGGDAGWDDTARMCRESNQPAVVLFTANWCPVCQALHNDVLSREDVIDELDHHYCFYVVDLTDPPPGVRDRARRFKVDAVPTMIRYDAKGQEVDRVNYLNAGQLLAWLRAGE